PLRGNRDGHEFIPDALKKGAISFLCEKDHPILKDLNFDEIQKAIIVDNTLYALGKLATFHRNRFQPFIIGITGSSGKTTTKELMGLVSESIGKSNVVITEKNYNNEIGVPFTLFRINEKTKIVVCEMGMNHLKEISRLTAMVKPSIGMITNVGPCHIENLGSLENIARAKAELIEGMPPKSILYVPESILHRNIFQEKAKEYKVILKSFSLNKNPNLEILERKTDGFLLNLFGTSVHWKIPGDKILENLSGVLAIAKEIHFSSEQIKKQLSLFKAKDKRFVVEKGYFHLINDTYNANPDSMESSLSSLKQISEGKNYFAILGDMKELGKFSKKYHEQVGLFCRKLGLSGLITYGADAKWIQKEFSSNKNNISNSHFDYESIDALVEYAKKNIPKGSYVLVKGSRSMKMERIVEGLK
ncbi:MAG TPA: UDP-N-acetylmuramoyl-tripeptide--D-alanyl-D-alanine ligase, partial [Leptospiraceae bacterium]|nr:UDP-N-acetylmuramoyl-tripeptide--D-alanyl-D-alanine ligase [Leptospiraceae bacterium]